MHTEILSPDQRGYTQAANILQAGGLVSFPTETVYGLGADARQDKAVARIFEAKNRPTFNPLIVHVADVSATKRYVVWNDLAERLSSTFWPGPLTLVLPLRSDSGLSPLVTANLPTLAIRVPANPVARALLRAFDGPVAAPSANPSGKISPTQAAHVINGLSGRIEAVLDGRSCDVGVESTILGAFGKPTLLRPGGLPQEALEQALGQGLETRQEADPLTAPGQMLSHYAPGAAVRLNATEIRNEERLLGFGDVKNAALNLSASGDLIEAAANLFGHLHALDAAGDSPIAVSPIPNTGLGRAINDRLKRAAAPRDM
ncbi:L-threonylcarbamoyladenylate synthase [Shimia marina]|uniref:Threonylcarbamoyl-AMP synthase n=1 Tax=Shimia marina TaxID=321267 RepID=A0A0P1FGD8_9RHOB|nr:L-threonylcarbamoyladenylate synthase [Shimia marina]CUH54239.1 t(6)A37 threonylcarbamoyladenosine biosynthesis protein RimN [Shimia marina]SFD98329.1 translation factor SUA5 [Shimia marina]